MKKNGKRLGALLMALVMIVSLVPVSALAARVEDDAVQIAAPDTAVYEAKPAGAVDAAEVADVPDAEDVPAVLAEGELSTMYWRHTGPIEPGIYTIYSANGARYLHNSGETTNQCGATLSGDRLEPGTAHPNNHLWQIAGNPTDGYTIQGVDGADSQNYLTATASGTQLALNSSSSAAVKLSFTPSGNGYKVSPVDDATKYFQFNGSDGWNFSTGTDNNILQFFKGTSIVNVADMTPTGPNPYSGEGLDNLKDDNYSTHYGSWDPFTTEEGRYVQIELPNARWLSGLGWVNRGASNGAVTKYAIVASMDGSSWYPVADNREGTDWVKTASTWNVVFFDAPIKAKFVKVLGVTTQGNYISCAELRLAVPDSDPTTYSVSGTVKCDGDPVEGVAVTVAWGTATTQSDGTFTVEGLTNGTYTATVTSANHATKTVEDIAVNGADVTLTDDITLEAMDHSISGTIYGKETADGAAAALAGAKVELVQDNDEKSFVHSVPATYTDADGNYKLNANAAPLPANYKIRVSKDGYNAVISEASKRFEGDALQQAHTGVDVTLTKVGMTCTKTFAYDMNTADSRPTLGFQDAATKPSYEYVSVGDGNQALKLSFPNTSRMNNLVTLTGTGVKNGTVEFDAHREGTYANAGRFGLALRLKSATQWIYFGLENNDKAYFHEYWNNEPNHDTAAPWSSTQTGPSFGKGDTRHFKVTIRSEMEGETEKTKISLEVDGVSLFSEAAVGGNGNGPTDAADVGFICGNNGWGVPCEVTIDNLYIFRNDPTFTVTLGTDPALTAKISDSAGDKDLDNNQAAGGDVIKITCENPGDGKVLDAVTVTGADSATVATQFHAAEGDNPAYFTFTMPESNVSVTGTVRTVVGNVTIEGEKKVGETLTANVDGLDETDADKVSYQWYHLNNENEDGAAWVPCTNGNAKTKTVAENDTGKKVKVEVTGKANNGTYATTVTKSATTTENMAPADTQVTGVTIARTEITMWKNCADDPDEEDNTVMGQTVELTATVGPENATNPQVAWSSSNSDIVSVAANGNQGNVYKATLTAHANTAANTPVTITVTVTSANGTTKTDTVAITVKTKAESIAVKNGTTAVTMAAPAKVYLNDGDDTAPRSITLVGTLTPTDASDKGLSWALADGSATGKISIQPVGAEAGDPDSAESSGNGVTISAEGSNARNVGEVTVTVSAQDEMGTTTSFKVQVWRKLAHDVSITGTPKFGETLEVNTSSLDMAQTDKDKLTYQWKRDGSNISGATSSTYPLVEADIGATISVDVTAGANTFYEGTKTASTATTVAKADAPAAPTGLNTTDCTTDDNNDGTITGLTANTTYDVSKKDGDGNWGVAESKTTDASGVITGLTPGDYRVRVQETTTTKPGAYSTALTIQEKGASAKPITIATGIEHGSVSTVRSKVEADETVTITVEPDTGYQLKAGTLTVTPASGGTAVAVTAGSEANTWTFTMPDDGVTITAQFELTKRKITHALTNLSCDQQVEHDENGDCLVDYGVIKSITLIPDEGYELPDSITVTYTDGTEAPTTRCSYNNETGVISFPQGVQRNITITATATPITYAVGMATTSTRITLSGGSSVAHSGSFSGTLTVSDTTQYKLPDTITVTMGGTALTAGTGYTYNSSTGAITISNVTGNVVITATAVRKTTPLTSVTINIQHTDTSTTEENIPHVGDTLRAVAAATGATGTVTATYKWYVGDSTTAAGTSQTYTVKAGDKDKTIKVVATGTDSFSGEVNATTAAVKEKTVPATDISLDKSTATVEFGKTVQLTATVDPEDATDKTVTWTSSNETVATVSNSGLVTAVGVGTATITATNSAGDDDTCSVTVTAAQVSVSLSGAPKVGQTLTATITPAGATTRSIYWYRVGAGNGGTNDPIDNNNQTTYTLVEADAGYKIMVSVEGSGNYNTGTTASATTESSIAGENEELPTYTITVADDIANGTVTADPTEASEGDTVTLTVTPASGYKLDTLTVTKADSSEVTVAENNTFTMPGGAVTVTATFVEDTTPPDTTALEAAIAAAKAAKAGVVTKPEDTAEDTVSKGTKYVTEADLTALNDAIAAAEAELAKADKTAESMAAAVTALNTAVETFNGKLKTGTKQTSTTRPSSTSTVTNPDGSTTTTTTKPDGTKTQTTEKPDGTKEIVETKRDGTVIETTEKPDGTKESVKTQPDGTVVETVVAPDGTKESVMTQPDGTVTETVIDTEGAMTEKVTDPEENVTITVTDPEGEELAKVEIPAEIAEPETKFDDAEEHWAKESINKIAGLGLVNGTGDNKYGTESSMTRGQLATVLYRLSNGKSGYRVSFNDVELGQYYTEGVAWAAKAKVVNGYTTEIFAPNDTITREQLAVMLCRYAKLIGMDTKADATALDKFVDGGNAGAWAVDGMAWCVANGILQGRGQSNLDPTSKVTRAEVAVMLDRFIELIK